MARLESEGVKRSPSHFCSSASPEASTLSHHSSRPFRTQPRRFLFSTTTSSLVPPLAHHPSAPAHCPSSWSLRPASSHDCSPAGCGIPRPAQDQPQIVALRPTALFRFPLTRSSRAWDRCLTGRFTANVGRRTDPSSRTLRRPCAPLVPLARYQRSHCYGLVHERSGHIR